MIKLVIDKFRKFIIMKTQNRSNAISILLMFILVNLVCCLHHRR